MKAITVKYIGQTNTKPARYVATAEGGPKPHRFSVSANNPNVERTGTDSMADYAAVELCKKMDWTQHDLIRGGLNGKGDLVYVMDGPGCRINPATGEVL